jgi:hypothetical protein
MDGRWDDKDQPSLRQSTQSKRDLLLADFNFEEERNLDIAFFDTTSNEFVAFNNDNFNCQNQKKPEHVLKGDRFRAEIRLVAVYVDVTYSVVFTTTGRRDDPSQKIRFAQPCAPRLPLDENIGFNQGRSPSLFSSGFRDACRLSVANPALCLLATPGSRRKPRSFRFAGDSTGTR